jgi:ferredoxin
MPTIKFTREKKSVECESGAKLRDVAIQHGVQLYPGMKKYFNCHGFGHCGECRVHVVKGMESLAPKTLQEKFRIAVSWFKFGHEHEVRLACQARVNGDVEILTQPEFNWFGERPATKKAAE